MMPSVPGSGIIWRGRVRNMPFACSRKLAAGLLALIFVAGLGWRSLQPETDPFKAAAIVNPTFPSLTYGIQVFTWWDGGETGLHLDWVRLMSYSHVKQTFAWRDIEPLQDVWDWTQADRILAEINKRKLRLIARLGQVPQWALAGDGETSAHDTPPAKMEDWSEFCFTLAQRYRGQIAAYQIWNEPNLSREWGNQPPDAAAYVELLAVCSQAIRQADPNAILISAGLAPTGNNDDTALPDDVYLDRMYRSDFQQYIDVVGVHAPGFDAPEIGPDDAEAKNRWFTFRRVEDLRKIMLLYGDEARQMAIMEFGYTTDTRNPKYQWFRVSDEEQADMLLRAYEYAIENWRPWIGLMTLIYMPDPKWRPEDEEYWWSITKPEKAGDHRPAFFVLANMRKVCGDYIIPARAADSPVARGQKPAPICP